MSSVAEQTAPALRHIRGTRQSAPGPAPDTATVVRALRLPFVTASVLPYVCGALLARGAVSPLLLFVGGAAVLFTHLSANVMNDYADAQTGVDALDPAYYGFFGGSKLIQRGLLSPRFYLVSGIVFAFWASVSVCLSAWLASQPVAVPVFLLVCALGWAYSCRPAALVYRGWGELVVFLLFGVAAGCGGYFLQTGTLAVEAVLLSVAHGFLVAGILVANEVPDAPEDRAAGKRTLVVRVGAERGHLLYAGCAALAFGTLTGAAVTGALPTAALAAVALGLPPAVSAWRILRTAPHSKPALVQASRRAIGAHGLTSLALVVVLWRC